MEIDLLKLLSGSDLELHKEREQFVGTTRGIVTEIGDSSNLGRVKVRLPYIAGCQTGWARIAAPGAGRDRGNYWVPEVGDEVIVAFEHGDLRYPYIFGGVWSDTAPPPESDPRTGRRELKSKEGHVILFKQDELTIHTNAMQQIVLSDAAGAERILIADKTGKTGVLIDVTGKAISITAPGGRISLDAEAIELHAKKITIRADAKLELNGVSTTLNGSAIQIAGGG